MFSNLNYNNKLDLFFDWPPPLRLLNSSIPPSGSLLEVWPSLESNWWGLLFLWMVPMRPTSSIFEPPVSSPSHVRHPVQDFKMAWPPSSALPLLQAANCRWSRTKWLQYESQSSNGNAMAMVQKHITRVTSFSWSCRGKVLGWTGFFFFLNGGVNKIC